MPMFSTYYGSEIAITGNVAFLYKLYTCKHSSLLNTKAAVYNLFVNSQVVSECNFVSIGKKTDSHFKTCSVNTTVPLESGKGQ